MLRYSFLGISIISAINFLLTDELLVQLLLAICLLAGSHRTTPKRLSLPPPPSMDLWSEAPDEKEREMKVCSHCGKAVDKKWSMCPYCSKKV